MFKRKGLLILFILALLGGCALLKPEIKKPPLEERPVSKEEQPVKREVISPLPEKEEVLKPGKKEPSSPEDLAENLFLRAYNYLFPLGANSPDYPGAIKAFEKLIQEYPQGRWSKLSENMISFLKRFLAREMETSSLQRENAKLKKEEKSLREENERLKQEREQLKKEAEALKQDIQRLRDIDIELEKKEKKLK